MSLGEVVNMAALQFTVGGSGGMLPQEILMPDFRCIYTSSNQKVDVEKAWE